MLSLVCLNVYWVFVKSISSVSFIVTATPLLTFDVFGVITIVGASLSNVGIYSTYVIPNSCIY